MVFELLDMLLRVSFAEGVLDLFCGKCYGGMTIKTEGAGAKLRLGDPIQIKIRPRGWGLMVAKIPTGSSTFLGSKFSSLATLSSERSEASILLAAAHFKGPVRAAQSLRKNRTPPGGAGAFLKHQVPAF